jgi:hypothetical protein
MDRRTWLQFTTLLAAARSASPQRGGDQQPLRVTREQVQAALKLLGLEFPDSEIELMLRRVNNSLGGFEAIRKIQVAYDVEPAFTFHPGLPGRVPGKGPARFTTIFAQVRTAKAPKDLEQLAFYKVSELAPLVRSRTVTSTELTKMYLTRLK